MAMFLAPSQVLKQMTKNPLTSKVNARRRAIFEAHLNLQGDLPTFEVIYKKLSQALSKHGNAKSKELVQKTEDILQGTYPQSMILSMKCWMNPTKTAFVRNSVNS